MLDRYTENHCGLRARLTIGNSIVVRENGFTRLLVESKQRTNKGSP